jgi:hypothetical protein
MNHSNSNEAGSPANRVSEHLRESYDAAVNCVSDHPASSIMVVFGVGFGLGLLLGHALAEPPRDERHGLTVLGRQMLEAMREHMPRSLARRLPA